MANQIPGESMQARSLARLGLQWWLGWLQIAVALLALTKLVRGASRPPIWVALFFAVPVLRLAVSAAYRSAVRTWLAELWRQAEAYPTEGVPWRSVLVFVAAPVLALLTFSSSSMHSGDTEPVILVATSLACQGDWELSEYDGSFTGSSYSPHGELPYFLRRTRAGVHSAYPLGMVTFAAPVALLSRAVGGDLSLGLTRERLEKLTASCVAAGCLSLFFLLSLHLVAARPALVMTALLATGSALYSTVGQALWQHGGVIFCSLAVLLLEFRHARKTHLALTLLQGVALALMLACRLSSGLFVLALGAWVLVRAPRRAILLACVTAAAFAPWAWLHWSIYDTPLGPSSGQLSASNWTADLLGSLAGVLASPSRGLLVYQPWLLLAVAALVPAIRRQLSAATVTRSTAPVGWPLFCVAAIGLHLALISSWRCWSGGCCWGSRLVSEVVPLCALLLLQPLAILWGSRTGRGLIATVGLLSLLMHVPAVYTHADMWNAMFRVDQTNEHLWSWAHPPFLFPLQFGVP